MTNSPIGHRRWAFTAGNIPAHGTGPEPEFTSRDELCILNAGSADACAAVTVYFADRDPVGAYRIMVPAARVRHVRINDLIEPEAVPLTVPYAMVVTCGAPIVVQVRRLDTRQSALALAVDSGTPV
ncbi:sensory rhodopsin transducer [Hoyosella altamirensis]|uniref:Sensory rhodopsin transducer n=1 Tax=Hoyosella altamirensis TaxID=616997 RepID=A0A839RPQ7_9ACTN|nr:sensory rhodopsin transducer [Hoyosella altamirensis]MBB3038785.1 hypothetical protein [Hoyosella altamirensis]